MRLGSDGAELWIANTTEGSVSVVDVARFQEVARIPVGPAPIQVAFLPDNSRVLVTLAGADAVVEVDRATREVRRRIPVGPGPAQLYAAPDGRHVLVANQGTRDAPGTGVSVVDAERGIVLETLTTGRGAHGVTITADGTRAFVTNMFDDSVSEIDVERMAVSRRFAVGGSPNGVTWLAA